MMVKHKTCKAINMARFFFVMIFPSTNDSLFMDLLTTPTRNKVLLRGY